MWVLYRVKSVCYRLKRKIISFLSFALFVCVVLVGVVVVSEIVTPYDNPVMNTISHTHVLDIAGADGHRITLANNVSARDPSYEDLLNFLMVDQTDEIQYNYSSFVCADFAETVHNNAENAGIKAGYVSVDFYEINDGHACNVFNTTDRGLIFIDCTGYREGYIGNCDTIVTMKIGEKYDVSGLFGSRKYYSDYNNKDLTVKTYEIYW